MVILRTFYIITVIINDDWISAPIQLKNAS